MRELANIYDIFKSGISDRKGKAFTYECIDMLYCVYTDDGRDCKLHYRSV